MKPKGQMVVETPIPANERAVPAQAVFQPEQVPSTLESVGKIVLAEDTIFQIVQEAQEKVWPLEDVVRIHKEKLLALFSVRDCEALLDPDDEAAMRMLVGITDVHFHEHPDVPRTYQEAVECVRSFKNLHFTE